MDEGRDANISRDEEPDPSGIGALLTERGRLYTSGLLNFPLFQLIPLWLEELSRVRLSGGKDSCPVDVPHKPETVRVDVDGQTVEITPDAWRDDDGHKRAEVRERHSRTDLAILGVLAAAEGGEPDPHRLRADYQRLYEGREPERGSGFVGVPTESEKALRLAHALLEEGDPEAFAALSERERRERIVSVAKRVGSANKALRELALDLETGTVRPAVRDAQRDVLAAELHDLKRWTWPEIGRYLGIPQTPGDEAKNDNQRARKAAERGRVLLKQASLK